MKTNLSQFWAVKTRCLAVQKYDFRNQLTKLSVLMQFSLISSVFHFFRKIHPCPPRGITEKMNFNKNRFLMSDPLYAEILLSILK